jgi:hypothetical protein
VISSFGLTPTVPGRCSRADNGSVPALSMTLRGCGSLPESAVQTDIKNLKESIDFGQTMPEYDIRTQPDV